MNIKDAFDLCEVLKEENNKETSMIFIDFAKAYDSVNHKLLEQKIINKY